MTHLPSAIVIFIMLFALPCFGQTAHKSEIKEEKVGPKNYLAKYPSLISLNVRDGTITAGLAPGQTMDPKLQLCWIVVSEKEGQVLSRAINAPLPLEVKLDSLLFQTGNVRYHIFIQTFEKPGSYCISNIVGVSKSNGRYLVRKQGTKP